MRLSSPDLAQKQLDQAKAIGEAFPWFEPKFAGDCVKIQAEISMRSAQYPKALSQFELLCERTDISPQDRVYAMKRIVRCLLKLKRLEEAEQRCHQFLNLASGPIENAEVTYALADVYSEQGRHADCVETLEKATRLYQAEGLTPGRAFVETSLGGLYGSLGMFSENRDPHVVNYLCGKKSAALFSLRAGQTEEARQLASFVFETSEERWGPNHLATLSLCILGACSEIDGNLSNAEELRLQARSRLDTLKFHPVNTIETLRQLGYHYFRTGQYHKAEAVFQDALQRNPREQIFAHDLERAMALSIHRPLLPIGEAAEVHWKVTAEQPSPDWTLPEYDDDSWTSKRAPLGNTHWDPYRLAHSEWRSSNIWLRAHLMLDTRPKDSVSLLLAHRGSVSVYINGRHACSPEQTHLGAYQFVEISPQAKAALRPGANVIAVRCNATNSPFFDLGIYEESPAMNEQAIERRDHQEDALADASWDPG